VDSGDENKEKEGMQGCISMRSSAVLLQAPSASMSDHMQGDGLTLKCLAAGPLDPTGMLQPTSGDFQTPNEIHVDTCAGHAVGV